ncbi:uncharacterized protein LOC123697889 isoform X2 [Colias croceus]|uniref:uncharacterized protein LOC123697889 isoform X2 n=1 Tax=Colias crocea TaxID=72248 RepID=UPI001E2810CA|nr:uncharacterized protein LOC123697889 isoform X2 [Colias croceus]
MVLYIKHMLVAYVILNIVSNALCIKCWSCRSSNDPKCADPFDNSTVPITDCNQEKGLRHLPGVRPSMCRKIRQKERCLPEEPVVRRCSPSSSSTISDEGVDRLRSGRDEAGSIGSSLESDICIPKVVDKCGSLEFETDALLVSTEQETVRSGSLQSNTCTLNFTGERAELEH